MSNFDPFEILRLKLNPDGTVTRLLDQPVANADPEPHSESVVTKDVILDAEKDTSVRIYLPVAKLRSKGHDGTSTNSRLPIVVFFHTCGFILTRSKYNPLHLRTSFSTCAISAIFLLVDHRLAPENRLPAQYEDGMDCLLWLKRQAMDPNGEKWLKDYGDFSRCYLFGSGSGGNIVFNVALRALDVDLKPLNIAGLILNQPLFGSAERTKSDVQFSPHQLFTLPVLDFTWELALPEGADRDHPYCNPLVDGPHKKNLSSLQRCFVFGLETDSMIDTQLEFVQMLVRHGVQVEARFDEPGFHGMEVVDSRLLSIIISSVKAFIDEV